MAIADANGSISPMDIVPVIHGMNQTFTITPNVGYRILDVEVDDVSVGRVSTFTFSNVVSDHMITASFESIDGRMVSSSTWFNQAIEPQYGTFTVDFDTISNLAKQDAITGLSTNPATTYANLATIVRFNNAGYIDVRNGTIYISKVPYPYVVGNTYHIRMLVNVRTHKYDVFVKEAGKAEVQLAAGASFRSDQGAVTSLSNLSLQASSGSHEVFNFVVKTIKIPNSPKLR